VKSINPSNMYKSFFLIAIVGIFFASCSQDKTPEVYNGTAKNAIINDILTRRSIREYKDQAVPNKLIDSIMKCAIYAPSANNNQSWEVRIIKNKQLLDKVNDHFLSYAKTKKLSGHAALANVPGSGFHSFYKAPVLIVLAHDKNNPYSLLDAGLITENILLSAHALGLGTCPLGSLVTLFTNPDNQDIIKPLNFSDNFEPCLAIALGSPNENPLPKERFSDKVKYVE
jgi:nitroreductase